MRKDFVKKGFVLKIVPKMKRKGKDKPSQGLECCMKVCISLKRI
jgi:hypothetical protein